MVSFLEFSFSFVSTCSDVYRLSGLSRLSKLSTLSKLSVLSIFSKSWDHVGTTAEIATSSLSQAASSDQFTRRGTVYSVGVVRHTYPGHTQELLDHFVHVPNHLL